MSRAEDDGLVMSRLENEEVMWEISLPLGLGVSGLEVVAMVAIGVGVRSEEDDGWSEVAVVEMRRAGLGKVLYVDPNDVYPSSYKQQ